MLCALYIQRTNAHMASLAQITDLTFGQFRVIKIIWDSLKVAFGPVVFWFS